MFSPAAIISHTRLALALLLCLLALFSGGCWDRREINQLAFFSSIAVDLEGDLRSFVAEIRDPKGGGGGGGGTGGGGIGGGGAAPAQRQVLLASGRGETLLAAGRALALKLPRRGYIAHTRAIIIGEELARQGIREVISFVDRNTEFRRTLLFLLSRGPAKDILFKAQGGLQNSLGAEIEGLAQWVKVSGYGFIPSVNQVLLDLSQGAATTVLPVIELGLEPIPPVTGAGTTGSKSGAGGDGAGGTVEEPEQIRTLGLAGSGLFQQDKLVGWFDETQTRGWAWVKNHVRQAILELPCDIDNTRVSVNIFAAKAKVSMDAQEGILVGKIEVEVEGNLLEQQCNHDFTVKEASQALEEQMTDRIAAEITSALEAARAAGTDVFDFGAALYRKEPQLWQQLKGQWNETFKTLPVTVEVKATLRRTGLNSRPWQPQGS